MPLKDRISKKLSSWMDHSVSWAGNEVLVKVVAQAIPTYAMSVLNCLRIHAHVSSLPSLCFNRETKKRSKY